MPTGIFATLQKSSEPATARGRVERNLNALYGIYFPESPLMSPRVKEITARDGALPDAALTDAV